MAKKGFILNKNKDFLKNMLNYVIFVENIKHDIFYLYEIDILFVANL